MSDNKAIELFRSADEGNVVLKYKKTGIIEVQPVIVGFRLETYINGELETVKIAEVDDVLVTNSTGEQYLLQKSKLEERYTFQYSRLNDKDSSPIDIWEANGIVWAVQYKGESFQFMAPWNESMLCNDGDFICSPVRRQYSDVYRIEQSVMKITYKQLPS